MVDSRPLLEGKQLLKKLVEAGVKCTYVQLNALSFVIKEVSKVFVGAHALLSNGFVMSRAGTALISMMAQDQGVPVIVCCETYKFSDRVQLDSFVNNEIGVRISCICCSLYLSFISGCGRPCEFKSLQMHPEFCPSTSKSIGNS